MTNHGHSMLDTDASQNGWTGGQYSLYRFVFGLYLLIHFSALIPWGAEVFSNAGAMPASASPVLKIFPNMFALCDSPLFVTGVLTVAAGLSMLLAVGYRDRLAAIGLWYVWACLFGRNPLIANPGLPYVGLLLLVHACLPSAPYGSVGAHKRVDPRGGWFLPQSIFVVVWILMAVGYSYSGYTKLVSPSWVEGTAIEHVLNNPLSRPGFGRETMLLLPSVVLNFMTWAAIGLELLYVPLSFVRRLRPWIWFLMLSMHLGLMLLIDFADLSFGMVVLHLFTFDPAWVRPRGAHARDLVLYDGQCGLCHGAVRFLLAEDRAEGGAFIFAPLESDSGKAALSGIANLPDSIVVKRVDGRILYRSAAVLYLLQRLGGAWHVFAFFARFVPAVLRDTVYDGIAKVRRQLFAKPGDACPILPPDLRKRFSY
ncbi:MAG: DCC1-like thiol-disulfide oxidoreductase family protein [Candidatus Obscuribacterales bacterium]|nr:DCC1-like thiol-disulfide oxidoreductase family protein [Candidatus Obscuribacterales bacterium]